MVQSAVCTLATKQINPLHMNLEELKLFIGIGQVPQACTPGIAL